MGPYFLLRCLKQLAVIYTLRQKNFVLAIPFSFFMIYFNIIIPSTSRSSQCFFPSGCSTKILHVLPFFCISATCPQNIVIPDFNTRIMKTYNKKQNKKSVKSPLTCLNKQCCWCKSRVFGIVGQTTWLKFSSVK